MKNISPINAKTTQCNAENERRVLLSASRPIALNFLVELAVAYAEHLRFHATLDDNVWARRTAVLERFAVIFEWIWEEARSAHEGSSEGTLDCAVFIKALNLILWPALDDFVVAVITLRSVALVSEVELAVDAVEREIRAFALCDAARR